MICLLVGSLGLAIALLFEAWVGNRWIYVRSVVTLTGLGQLDLHSVDAVDGVDEQNQDEYEGDFEAILELCDDRVLGDEPERSILLANLVTQIPALNSRKRGLT